MSAALGPVTLLSHLAQLLCKFYRTLLPPRTAVNISRLGPLLLSHPQPQKPSQAKPNPNRANLVQSPCSVTLPNHLTQSPCSATLQIRPNTLGYTTPGGSKHFPVGSAVAFTHPNLRSQAKPGQGKPKPRQPCSVTLLSHLAHSPCSVTLPNHFAQSPCSVTSAHSTEHSITTTSRGDEHFPGGSAAALVHPQPSIRTHIYISIRVPRQHEARTQ